MGRYFCKSDFCDRTDGFAFDEIESNFLPDRTFVCLKCKERQHQIEIERALRDEALRAELQRMAVDQRANVLERLAQARASQIDRVMAALGEPNLVLERSSTWKNGPQHLGGPYYRCASAGCNQPCRDPVDFSIIYRAGKTPLFNGKTVCDDCFERRRLRQRDARTCVVNLERPFCGAETVTG